MSGLSKVGALLVCICNDFKNKSYHLTYFVCFILLVYLQPCLKTGKLIYKKKLLSTYSNLHG